MSTKNNVGTPAERVWRNLDFGEGCWIWTGHIELNGYGSISGVPAGTSGLVHRIVYTALVGPIPEGIDLHHDKDRCGNKLCCNPAHLKPIPHDEHGSHTRRPDQTKCLSGRHDWIPENLIKRGRGGYLTCKLCNRERDRAYRLKKRDEQKKARAAA